MKLLVLGGNGMAGHMIVRYFQTVPDYGVFYTTRDYADSKGIFLDAADLQRLETVIRILHPDVIVNCVGILNDNATRHEQLALTINGVLPHQLRKLAETVDGKLIHISTDCVFSGAKGHYAENDLPDGSSVYARTKAMGEIRSNRHLTVRTSIVGPEIRSGGIGLLEWFFQQHGEVNGYTRVYWNGVTTLQLAKSIRMCIERETTGLLHLTAPSRISKYELLQLFQETFDKEDVHINPDSGPSLDRTLVNTRTDCRMPVPGYETMLAELRDWMRSP